MVEGVAFKKTFSYAGFEQQPKSFKNPGILLLNVELEIKSEKENAEVRLTDPTQYQSIVDAEWTIIYNKLEKIVASGMFLVSYCFNLYSHKAQAQRTTHHRTRTYTGRRCCTGAKIVLSRLPIGDLATQYFADRDIFCAGRVESGDMDRVSAATGGVVQA